MMQSCWRFELLGAPLCLTGVWAFRRFDIMMCMVPHSHGRRNSSGCVHLSLERTPRKRLPERVE
jgi:hypothetical protein